MHAKFKGNLITGYLEEEDRFKLWKEQFKVHCNKKKVIEGPTDGHFDFLEKEGKLKIGDYAVIREMFEHVDLTALDVIDKASADIPRPLQNNENKS